MVKYIYAVKIDRDGKIFNKDKYTVVYSNKTYYYCKVPGTDELKQIAVNNVNSGKYYWGVQYVTSDAEIAEQIAIWREQQLKIQAQNAMRDVEWRRRQLKEAEDAYNTLVGYEQHPLDELGGICPR